MVQQARFRSSLIGLIAFVFFVGCAYSEQPKFLEEKDPDLKKEKGTYYFQNRPFSGTIYTLFQSGDTLSVFMLQDGVKQGLGKKWWPNGNLKFSANYHMGIYHGKVAEWYENGSPYAVNNYDQGQEFGKQTAWKPNGDIKANYEVIGDRKYGLTGIKNCSNVLESE